MLVDDVGVDLQALERWMDERAIGEGDLVNPHVLTGGTQNILLRFTRGGRDFVLRRGPIHLRPKTNEHLLKEMRFLEALAQTQVPHPRLLGACTDPEILGGAVFYLMEPVDGFNVAVEVPPDADRPRVRHRMGLAAVEALVTLGEVDYEAVGLGQAGNPEGFLERQVARWRHQLDSYEKIAGYPGTDLPGLAPVASWLEVHRPSTWRPGILHGDYHLANLMYAPTGATVAAIIDWEMSTIGDPLLDFGWLLATWPTPGETDVIDTHIGRLGGLPDREELVRHYGDRAGRGVDDINWYIVLACYKLGIVLEGTYARSCAGLVPKSDGDLMHERSTVLLERARAFAGV